MLFCWKWNYIKWCRICGWSDKVKKKKLPYLSSQNVSSLEIKYHNVFLDLIYVFWDIISAFLCSSPCLNRLFFLIFDDVLFPCFFVLPMMLLMCFPSTIASLMIFASYSDSKHFSRNTFTVSCATDAGLSLMFSAYGVLPIGLIGFIGV